VADPGFEVRVDDAVHAAQPDYVALVLLASGLANGPSDAGSEAQLAAAEAHMRASRLARATDHPHIAAWRAAFSAFGAKPSRYPSSAEALIARVLKGQPLPRVNALVDLYNAISVRHVVPVGGEDADRLEGSAAADRRGRRRAVQSPRRRHRRRAGRGRGSRLAR
jgi:DNA/RNA-binding domain of Phe-tRNA-synthetase-like protein